MTLTERFLALRTLVLASLAIVGAQACGGSSGGGGGPEGGVLACGQPGTPCCEENGCNGGGCCVSGICMAVGGTCVGLGGGVCNAGVCGSCGGPGLACCGSDPATGVCTSSGTTCSAGICSKCGGVGQACCASSTGAATCQLGMVCTGSGSDGTCATCGSLGDICCTGSACSEGCCSGGRCLSPGTGNCPAGTPDGGRQPDVPASGGGADGRGGSGGTVGSDAAGAVGSGGIIILTGGSGGSIAIDAPGAGGGGGVTVSTGGSGGILASSGGSGGVSVPTGGLDGGAAKTGGAGGSTAITSTGGGTVVPGTGGSTVVPGTGGSTVVPGTGGSTAGTGGAGGSSQPPWTPPAGCGDGVVAFPERCDDGNDRPFDGCSSDCQPEPTCTGTGPCTSTCGDGIVIGEECDDGNTADGDGCSSACKVEPGFVCSQPALGDSILVPAVYRDFRYHNPTDFEAGVSGSTLASPGMVKSLLDGDGKPVYTGLTGTAIHVASLDSFASWYRDTATVNHATPSKLQLWAKGDGTYANRWGANGEQWPVTETAFFCGEIGSGVLDSNGVEIPCTYRYGTGTTDCDDAIAKGETLLKCLVSNGTYEGVFVVNRVDGTPVFFPVDNDPFTPDSERSYATIPPPYDATRSWPHDTDANGNDIRHNFSFTSELRYWFTYEPDKSYKLDITGDDDVWVFVNKQLAVDIGGIHQPVDGAVTLDSAAGTKFGLVAGNVYEVAVFQAERQSNSSTFKITLSGFNLAASVCQPTAATIRRR